MTAGHREITRFGGWRAYVAARDAGGLTRPVRAAPKREP